MDKKAKLEFRIFWGADAVNRLGGPAKLARLLGYEGDNGMRRVSNWSRRGIPGKVIINNPNIFAPLT